MSAVAPLRASVTRVQPHVWRLLFFALRGSRSVELYTYCECCPIIMRMREMEKQLEEELSGVVHHPRPWISAFGKGGGLGADYKYIR